MMLRARCLLFPLLSFSIALPSSLGAQQAAPRAKPSAGTPARNLAIHFDPQATQIHFKVGSLMRDVRGTFQFKGGALAIDPDSTLAQGELLVDATTGRGQYRMVLENPDASQLAQFVPKLVDKMRALPAVLLPRSPQARKRW